MKKRVFIVHGWEGHPQEAWFPWLANELTARGFQVTVPELPDATFPRIHTWVPTLAAAVGQPDDQTYFVGHSMGCQTIARYLEGLPRGLVVGGAVFVAGFFRRLEGLTDDAEERATEHHWLGTDLDLAKVKIHLRKSVAIFSDDDPWVPVDNQYDFSEKLGSKIIIEQGRKHFNDSAGVTELPSARDAVLWLAN